MKALLPAAALALAACAGTHPVSKPGGIDHIVLVWLKDPADPQGREEILAAAERLRDIPGLRSMRHGSPLLSERPVVDDSFDLGFVMHFDSVEALQDYGSHPVHLAAQTHLRKRSRKVVIYDIKPSP